MKEGTHVSAQAFGDARHAFKAVDTGGGSRPRAGALAVVEAADGMLVASNPEDP